MADHWGASCHALAGIGHSYGLGNLCGTKDSIIQFIDPSLTKSAFLITYSPMIHPIPDLCVWNDIEAAHVEPPPLKRKPGRPKLLRKRESHEKPKAARSGSVVCGKCKQPGHNKRTWKGVSTSKRSKVNNILLTVFFELLGFGNLIVCCFFMYRDKRL